MKENSFSAQTNSKVLWNICNSKRNTGYSQRGINKIKTLTSSIAKIEDDIEASIDFAEKSLVIPHLIVIKRY